MKDKPVVPRAVAWGDVDQAIAYFVAEATPGTALRFIDALEAAYRRIGRNPEAGSPRFAHELGLPGLRSWGLQGFPYLVFYVEHEDYVDVWRVLHGHRDIPAWLAQVT